MITDLQKKEIDKDYFPNGFPYKVKTFNPYSYYKRLDDTFESLQEYEATVKNIRHSNGLRFFLLIKGLNENDFIKEINNQYLNYTIENTEHSKHWLRLTYDLVLKGFSVAGAIDDVTLRGAFIKWYNITLNEVQPQQPKAVSPDNGKNSHPKHDPNLWNDDCFELFKYLYDCYYKKTKRQITNIWFYLKEDISTKYILKATKEQYEVFILDAYQIKITNFDKAPTKWEDKERNTIDDHRINFEDSLK